MGHKTLGTLDDRLYGQFIELAGRCVNGGIYDPGSPHARADGVRTDVKDGALVRGFRPGVPVYLFLTATGADKKESKPSPAFALTTVDRFGMK